MIRAEGYYRATGHRWIILFEDRDRMFDWCIKYPSTLARFESWENLVAGIKAGRE